MEIKIQNKTININKICSNIVSQAHGLMLSRKKTALFVFKNPRTITIHTWFMFYPIDLYFLDKNKQVIEVKKNMRPWSIYRAKNKASYLLEVPTD